MKIPRDVDYGRALDADVAWAHRQSADADIYYVANIAERDQDIDARFRIAGREAELFHPDRGTIEPAEYRIDGNRTTVPLRLAKHEAVFVVFRRPATSTSRTVAHAVESTLATVTGPWDVTFPPGLGAPARARFATLASWTTSADSGVKLFSGTASYTTTVRAQASWFRPGTRVLLDLGAVRDLAEVSVNGKPLGIAWTPPFRVDVTSAMKPGMNRIEVRVTNEWTNRLIGDRALPVGKKILAGGPAPFGGQAAAATLSKSGLLGPVRVLMVAPK
jgi:hypothetical protein